MSEDGRPGGGHSRRDAGAFAAFGGRNYFPEDAEAAAGRTPGVHRGRCVAFRLDGETGEAMGVAVETRLPLARHPELELAVRQRVSEALGLGEILVRAVPPGWVTRTTSGKPQRLLARQRLREAAFDPA